MRKELELLHGNLLDVVEDYFIAMLHQRIDSSILFLNELAVIYSYYFKEQLPFTENKGKAIAQTRILFEKLLKHSKENTSELVNPDFTTDFSDFNLQVSKISNSLPDKTKRVQGKDNFTALPIDSTYISYAKNIKCFAFGLSQLPIKLANTIKKWRKKPLKNYRIWRRTIPWMNLNTLFFNYYLPERFIALIEDVYSFEIEVFDIIAKFEDGFEKSVFTNNQNGNIEFPTNEEFIQLHENLICKGNELKNKLQDECINVFNQVFKEYSNIFEKIGTIELPAWLYNNRRIRKQNSFFNSLYFKKIRGWNISRYAILNDRALEKELIAIEYRLLDEFSKLFYSWRKIIDNRVNKKLEEFTSFLSDLQIKISSYTDKDLRSLLIALKFKVKKQLSANLIPEMTNTMADINIPGKIDRIENLLRQSITSEKVERAIFKGNNYLNPIRKKDLVYIIPHELLEFETLPEFFKVTKEIKSHIVSQSDVIQRSVEEIGRMAEYNIDTAITYFEKGSENIDKIRETALQGIERSINKTNEIGGMENLIFEKIEGEISEAIESFCKRIHFLANNENIFNIKLKITRARTKEKARLFRIRISNRVKNIIPNLFRTLGAFFESLIGAHAKMKKKLGLEKQTSEISPDIANFLADTSTAIDKLPYIYQRLFTKSNMSEYSFFTGRERELNQIIVAYKNWVKGRFAPVTVIGERGGGVSSVIEAFVKNESISHPVKHIDISSTSYTEKSFMGLFTNLFGVEFANKQALLSHLEMLPTSKVFVVEKIQHLYLRKVGGFTCLEMLFEIISKTHKNIFWILSCSQYAWDYLDKSMQISDHLAYIIKLSHLPKELINEIILKRHRISGYNITFQVPKHLSNNKKAKKLPEDEKQEWLRNEYFDYLNNIAKSNLSLAFLFWLRSTQKIEGNTITIAQLKQFDYSFLASLPNQKLAVLHVLLIHDGLDVPNLCEIFNFSEKDSRNIINLLCDDGIILPNENGLYEINALLYRQVVDILKKKNFLH